MPKHFRFVSPVEYQTVSKRTRGYLPHWEVDGAVYSITYRLADSLPADIIRKVREEYDSLLQRIAGSGEPTVAQRFEFDRWFARKLDEHLDAGYGECHLRNPAAAEIVVENLLHLNGGRYDLCAWCVMPNHVHVVMRLFRGAELDRVLHSWKSYTSNRINALLGRSGRLWMVEYHDRIVRGERDYLETVEYVLNNPEAAGLGEWPWRGVLGGAR
jgi:REP element-mobilizing transposase RayT